MTALQTMKGLFWRWLDDAAVAAVAIITRIAAPRRVRLVEGADGQWSASSASRGSSTSLRPGVLQFSDGHITGAEALALNGCHVDLVLRPVHFLFKPLELPSRATEFLDGIVRAQIDRLTPWNAEQAVFGCTQPADMGGGRIVVTVAATAKSKVAPFVQALAGQGVRSLKISTAPPDAQSDIAVLQESLSGLDVRRVRLTMLAVLAAFVLITAAVVAFATITIGELQARQDDVARRIAERRSALVAARKAIGDPVTAAESALARRKNGTLASVIVLEVLSQILPDHTYVTELRIEGDTLRVSGVTRDAPSLIRLIEQSPQFSRATFFAPTTRGPSDPGDRFHIEARIVPVFSLGS